MSLKHRVIPIACFITPHGYGHAARAAAVMEALAQSASGTVEFHIFTKVPRWFFRDSLTVPFHYHPVLTDIGLVQKTPLQADLRETVERLDRFLPFEGSAVEALARRVSRAGCRMVALRHCTPGHPGGARCRGFHRSSSRTSPGTGSMGRMKGVSLEWGPISGI